MLLFTDSEAGCFETDSCFCLLFIACISEISEIDFSFYKNLHNNNLLLFDEYSTVFRLEFAA